MPRARWGDYGDVWVGWCHLKLTVHAAYAALPGLLQRTTATMTGTRRTAVGCLGGRALSACRSYRTYLTTGDPGGCKCNVPPRGDQSNASFYVALQCTPPYHLTANSLLRCLRLVNASECTHITSQQQHITSAAPGQDIDSPKPLCDPTVDDLQFA